MVNNPASFTIAPMWHDFMTYAISKYSSPSDIFPAPGSDPDVATMPEVLKGNWNSDPTQGIHDILYWVNKDNPRGGRPSNPASDSQFAYWEYSVSLWAGNQPASTSPIQGLPTAAPLDGFRIASPRAGAEIPFGAAVTFGAESPRPQSILNVSYFANGALVGVSGQSPYLISYRPGAPGAVSLRAVAVHTDGTSEESTITFSIR